MKKKNVYLIIIALICIFSCYHIWKVNELKHDIGMTLWLMQVDQGDNLSYLERIVKSRDITDEEFRTIHRMVKFDERVCNLSGNKELEELERGMDSLLTNYFSNTISKDELKQDLKELLAAWEEKIDYRDSDAYYDRTYRKFRESIWGR